MIFALTHQIYNFPIQTIVSLHYHQLFCARSEISIIESKMAIHSSHIHHYKLKHCLEFYSESLRI